MSPAQQFCTFLLDGLLFGLDVERVQEVIRYQPLTPVPLAAPRIAGLINLRGQIVPAIDLRLQLGMTPRPAGLLPTNVVVRAPDGPLSLLVDEVGDVLTVAGGRLEPPPDSLDPAARRLLRGVCQLPHGLLLVLDDQAAITGKESNDG
jgi:purine-binding chemotaxis protein CheW